MPLFDHFHGLDKRRLPWETVAQAWAVTLMGWLNRRLKEEGYRAYAEVGTGTETRTEAPPDALRGYPLQLPAVVPDRFEVVIYKPNEFVYPVGVIAFATPSVKTEPALRDAFVRCGVAHLHRGTGFVLIDVVTGDAPNLHDSVLDVIAPPGAERLGAAQTCAVGYAPHQRRGISTIDVRAHRVEVARPLPTVPFVLADGAVLFLALESTYTAAIDATGL